MVPGDHPALGSASCESKKMGARNKTDNCALLHWLNSMGSTEEIHMLRAGLLWFMGVPLVAVILIWMLYF